MANVIGDGIAVDRLNASKVDDGESTDADDGFD
jgi:hypothetical protein